jgi:acyl-CoA synthetase (NDP forming)
MVPTDRFGGIGGLLDPPSITLIGASESNAVTGILLHNLLQKNECRFTGKLNIVNRRKADVHGLSSVESVGKLDGPVGLAVLLLPPDQVPVVLEEMSLCADSNPASGVVVFSSGAETGAIEAEEAMAEWSRRSSVPLLGPQSIGVARPKYGLLPIIAPLAEPVVPGPVSLIMQSAGLLGGAIRALFRTGVGLATAVSAGNAAGTSVLEIASFLMADPDTRLVAMYLESIESLNFLSDLGDMSTITAKPVVLCVGGSSEAGEAAARTHTGAVATSRRVLQGVCRQEGLILVDEVEDLLWSAQALVESNFTTARTSAVASYTSSGGGGVAIADAFASAGIDSPQPDEQTRLAIDPAGKLSTLNPLDAGAVSLDRPDEYRAKASALANDAKFGIVVNILSPGIPRNEGIEHHHFGHAVDFVEVVTEAGRLPVLCTPYTDSTGVEISWPGVPVTLGSHRSAVAVRALSLWTERSLMNPARSGGQLGRQSSQVDDDPSRKIVKGKKDNADGSREVDIIVGDEIRTLLSSLPATWPPQVVVTSEEGVWEKVSDLEKPWIVKSERPMAHRVIRGGVLPGITERTPLETAVGFMIAQFGPPVSVGHQVEVNEEFMIGMERTERYGALLAIGSGGSEVGQVAHVRRLPASLRHIEHVVGLVTADRDLEHLLIRFIERAQEIFVSSENIVTLDINPITLHEGSICVLDAKAHMRALR